MAHLVMAYIVIANIVMAYAVMAYVVMAYIVMTCVDMGYMAMGCIAMGYIIDGTGTSSRADPHTTAAAQALVMAYTVGYIYIYIWPI